MLQCDKTILIKRIRSLSDITPDTRDFIYALDSKDGVYAVWRVKPSTIGKKDVRDGRLFYIANFEFDAPISFDKVWHHDRPSGINATAVFRFRLRIGANGEEGFEQWLAANQNRDEVTIGDLVADVHSALEAYFKHGIDANSLDLILAHRFEAFIDSRRDADRLLPKWLELIEIKDLYATPLPTEEEIILEEEKRHRAEQAKRLRDIDDQLNIQIALNKLDDARKEYENRCEIRKKLHERALEVIENARRRDELEIERRQATTAIEKERLNKAIAETDEVYARIEHGKKKLVQEIKESNAKIVINSWWFKLLHSTYSHVVLGLVLVGVVIVSVMYVFRPAGRVEMLRRCDDVETRIGFMKRLGYSDIRFGFTNDIARIRWLCDSQSVVFNAIEAERLLAKVERAMIQLEDRAKDINPDERDMVLALERMHNDLMHQIELMPDELSLKAESKKLSSEIHDCLLKLTYDAGRVVLLVVQPEECKKHQKEFKRIMEFDDVADLTKRMNEYGHGVNLPEELLRRRQDIIKRLKEKGDSRDSDYYKLIVEGNHLCEAMESYPLFMNQIEILRWEINDMWDKGCSIAEQAQNAECHLTNIAQQAICDNKGKSFWTNIIDVAKSKNKAFKKALELFTEDVSKMNDDLWKLAKREDWDALTNKVNSLRAYTAYNKLADQWALVAQVAIVDGMASDLLHKIESSEPRLCAAIWDFDNNQSNCRMSVEGKRQFASAMRELLLRYPSSNGVEKCKSFLLSQEVTPIDFAKLLYQKGLLSEYSYYAGDQDPIREICAVYEKASSIGESWFRLAKIRMYDLYGTKHGGGRIDAVVKDLERGKNNLWMDNMHKAECERVLIKGRGY